MADMGLIRVQGCAGIVQVDMVAVAVGVVEAVVEVRTPPRQVPVVVACWEGLRFMETPLSPHIWVLEGGPATSLRLSVGLVVASFMSLRREP